MKELDFDELDRAVSSLMSDTTPTVSDTSDIPKEKLLDIPSSAPATAAKQPSFGTLEPETVKKALDTSDDDSSDKVTPAAPAIRRSSGRFMDVVHPSSDMKQAGNTPAQPSSRQGITISPTPSPLVVPSELPDVVADKPKAPETEPDNEVTSSDWPDPLDVSSKKEDTVVPEEDTAAEEPVEDEKPPLSSPFISDAKVEKRPLGGAPMSISETENAFFGEQPKEDTSADDQSVAPPAEFSAPLPEELQQDLVAIESGEAQLASAAEPVETPVVTPIAEEKPVEKTPEHPVKALIPDHFADEDVPKGPASIAQQYKEEPNSGDQSNGAIYDTEAYHKPLAHPAKKSSGWLWVIWIILILAVGAGIGAGLYYLGIVK